MVNVQGFQPTQRLLAITDRPHQEEDRVPEDFGWCFNRMVRPMERAFEDGLPRTTEVTIAGRDKAENKLAISHMGYLKRKADGMQAHKPASDPIPQTRLESSKDNEIERNNDGMQDDQQVLEPIAQTNLESSKDSSSGFFKSLKEWSIKAVNVVYKYTGLKYVVEVIKSKIKPEVDDAINSNDEPEVVDAINSNDESEVIVDAINRKVEPEVVVDAINRAVPIVDMSYAKSFASQPDRAKMLAELKSVQLLRGVAAPIMPRTAVSSPCSGQKGYDLSGLESAKVAEGRDEIALAGIAEIENNRAAIEADKLQGYVASRDSVELANAKINAAAAKKAETKHAKGGTAYYFAPEQVSLKMVKAKAAMDAKMAVRHKRQEFQSPELETRSVPSTVSSEVSQEDPKADRYAAIRELDEQFNAHPKLGKGFEAQVKLEQTLEEAMRFVQNSKK